MKIEKIRLHNYRIYQGENNVLFSNNSEKNISLIAGKNGFGKTSFLSSLIYAFYGKLMVQVEEKFKKDIKNKGGYDNYLKSLFNRNARKKFEEGLSEDSVFSVEVELSDLMIPSIPCKTVTIKRSFDLKTNDESLLILIDGDENELTKDVGYEVFINDFILPREIAKFFFFDAEKIVSLAEARSRSELRSLSRAYSEVLGIKKYEELKLNLETLLAKLRRKGATTYQKSELQDLIEKDRELQKLVEHNKSEQESIALRINNLQLRSDTLQESLIREGNSITLDELKNLKTRKNDLQLELKKSKDELKKLLDVAPFVIAGKKTTLLYEQLSYEHDSSKQEQYKEELEAELSNFSKILSEKLSSIIKDDHLQKEIIGTVGETLNSRYKKNKSVEKRDTMLDFSDEQYRGFKALYDNIRSSFVSHFNSIVKNERTTKALLNRTSNKIKQGEARQNNQLAKQFRREKEEIEKEISSLSQKKNELTLALGVLNSNSSSHKRILSEYEKNFKIGETDLKKYDLTKQLLEKINLLMGRIKEEKKYSLQHAIQRNLKQLMHKKEFIASVRVQILEDIMDVELLDSNGNIIDKDELSKGEQQLYATALLKALVDESGIKFPVFIDSPLQKFDVEHSVRIIEEFYPRVSEQVVLFPLLEKELSYKEFQLLKPNINKTYLIKNVTGGSVVKNCPVHKLFDEFKIEDDVYAH
ncbi:AAA family ATPase [Salegentibacter sp. F188]|uniref:AAA family ATPase n=1 Tax=Autumnicola patrickiae TaxID=3075591 RepID=A0ABU3DYE0_9FLAO|nr:AAA family ATPase [Salegentibacter sp. F188]MDT0688744.1 AAA family ATPase [Salegentibacter sp. F188]